MDDQCLIDGFGPVTVTSPGSVAELAELIRRSGDDNQALYPLGGRTCLQLGNTPDRPGIGVDLRKLDQVIDYPARDMTITVQTGITLAKLRETLQTEKQRLPIDVPLADRATLGGALATNRSGPRRLGSGTLRDYLIGVSALNDDGNEFKAGGRVVKNVAGYDLCKLLVGALGSLGVITQATLKLRPMPEDHALVSFGITAKDMVATLEHLHATRTRPACLEVLNKKGADAIGLKSDKPWTIIVGFEDNQAAIAWQVQQLQDELKDQPVHHVQSRRGQEADSVWSALVELPARAEGQVAFKANMLPSQLAELAQQADTEGWLLQAHAGNGNLLGQMDGADKAIQTHLASLRQALVARHGNLVITRCPPEWKKELPVWGAPRGDAGLMRQVREKMAPRNLFNPGRFMV